MANDKYTGNNRAIYGRATGSYEMNNHLQGRSGSETYHKLGPANKGKGSPLPTNPLEGGGINRATVDKGTGGVIKALKP